MKRALLFIDVQNESLIASDRLTIAGLAKQQGHHTACVGKWQKKLRTTP